MSTDRPADTQPAAECLALWWQHLQPDVALETHRRFGQGWHKVHEELQRRKVAPMTTKWIDSLAVLLASTIGAVVILLADTIWLGVALGMLIHASYLWGLSPRLRSREERGRITFDSRPEARLVKHR